MRLARWIIGGTISGLIAGAGIAIPWQPHRPNLVELDRREADVVFGAASNLLPSRNGYEVIEFVDYQCPACRSISGQLESIVEKTGHGAGLAVVQFPLPMHNMAFGAASAMMVAKEYGVDRMMHAKLMDSTDLSTLALENCGRSLGITVDIWRQKVRSKKTIDTVALIVNLGEKLGVRGTPTFVVRTPRGRTYSCMSLDEAVEFIGAWSTTPDFPWKP